MLNVIFVRMENQALESEVQNEIGNQLNHISSSERNFDVESVERMENKTKTEDVIEDSEGLAIVNDILDSVLDSVVNSVEVSSHSSENSVPIMR